MVSRGETAPGFSLPGSDGTARSTYELESYTADGATVLVFYPFDFSPVCTSELCRFRDAEWLTLTPDVDVLGISTDSAYAHHKFITDNNLSFPLLSDTSGDVIEEYDVKYEEWNGHRDVSKRAVFVLDSEQVVRYRWATEDATDEPNLEAIYRSITDLSSISIETAGPSVDYDGEPQSAQNEN